MRVHMGSQCALKQVCRAVEERWQREIFDKYGFRDMALCGLWKGRMDFAEGM